MQLISLAVILLAIHLTDPSSVCCHILSKKTTLHFPKRGSELNGPAVPPKPRVNRRPWNPWAWVNRPADEAARKKKMEARAKKEAEEAKKRRRAARARKAAEDARKRNMQARARKAADDAKKRIMADRAKKAAMEAEQPAARVNVKQVPGKVELKNGADSPKVIKTPIATPKSNEGFKQGEISDLSESSNETDDHSSSETANHDSMSQKNTIFHKDNFPRSEPLYLPIAATLACIAFISFISFRIYRTCRNDKERIKNDQPIYWK